VRQLRRYEDGWQKLRGPEDVRLRSRGGLRGRGQIALVLRSVRRRIVGAQMKSPFECRDG